VEAPMLGELEKQPELKVTEKSETTKIPNTEAKGPRKLDKMPENTVTSVQPDVKTAENTFSSIKEYSSVIEISENIEKEIDETKSTLGKYLCQLDLKRAVAEKAKKIRDIATKLKTKKQSKENPNQLEAKGIEIVLDPTTFHELMALESVVRSCQQLQQRLRDLQRAQEGLEPLYQLGDTEGIKYLVLEKEGIPERILLEIL
jgi:hypothetical protein